MKNSVQCNCKANQLYNMYFSFLKLWKRGWISGWQNDETYRKYIICHEIEQKEQKLKKGRKSGGKWVGRSHYFITPPVHWFLFSIHILSRSVLLKIVMIPLSCCWLNEGHKRNHTWIDKANLMRNYIEHWISHLKMNAC